MFHDVVNRSRIEVTSHKTVPEWVVAPEQGMGVYGSLRVTHDPSDPLSS